MSVRVLSLALFLVAVLVALTQSQSANYVFDNLPNGQIIMEPSDAYGAFITLTFNTKPDPSKSIFIKSDNSTRCVDNTLCNYSYLFPQKSTNAGFLVGRYSAVNKPSGNFTGILSQSVNMFQKKFIGSGSCASFLELKPASDNVTYPLTVQLSYFSTPTNKTMLKTNETICQTQITSNASTLGGMMIAFLVMLVMLIQ